MRKDLEGIVRVVSVKEELKEPPFVIRINWLFLNMKMNFRIFEFSVNSIQCLDHEGSGNSYYLIGIDIIKDR
jgi:hypothetical protein